MYESTEASIVLVLSSHRCKVAYWYSLLHITFQALFTQMAHLKWLDLPTRGWFSGMFMTFRSSKFCCWRDCKFGRSAFSCVKCGSGSNSLEWVCLFREGWNRLLCLSASCKCCGWRSKRPKFLFGPKSDELCPRGEDLGSLFITENGAGRLRRAVLVPESWRSNSPPELIMEASALCWAAEVRSDCSLWLEKPLSLWLGTRSFCLSNWEDVWEAVGECERLSEFLAFSAFLSASNTAISAAISACPSNTYNRYPYWDTSPQLFS